MESKRVREEEEGRWSKCGEEGGGDEVVGGKRGMGEEE